MDKETRFQYSDLDLFRLEHDLIPFLSPLADTNPPVRLTCGHAISRDAMKKLISHSRRCVENQMLHRSAVMLVHTQINWLIRNFQMMSSAIFEIGEYVCVCVCRCYICCFSCRLKCPYCPVEMLEGDVQEIKF